MNVRLGVLAAVLVTSSGCGSPAPVVGPDVRIQASASPSATGRDLSDSTLWLSFEQESIDYDGVTVFPDALDGPFDGRVVTSKGGSVEVVPGEGSSRAVAFPERCADVSGCPHVIVEVASDPALDPRDDDFAYGASVWLAPDQTTTGSNIVQKGRFGTDGGLWKLQVDSDEGHPSCVMRSEDHLVSIRSRATIADSLWHHVVCRRDDHGISIDVDGEVSRKAADLGQVSSSWPVRIGGPGVGDLDDQFHGRIDDVFLRVASEE